MDVSGEIPYEILLRRRPVSLSFGHRKCISFSERRLLRVLSCCTLLSFHIQVPMFMWPVRMGVWSSVGIGGLYGCIERTYNLGSKEEYMFVLDKKSNLLSFGK